MAGQEITRELQDTAKRARELVELLGGEIEGRAIYTVSLKEALDPLRDLTLRTICGQCGKQVAWYALDATEAFVVAFQHRCRPNERRGGIWDCRGTNPWPAEGRRFWPWMDEAQPGKTSVTMEDIHTPGYPLRLKLTCPKCGAQYVTKSTTRLTLFLDAVAHREGKLTLK